MSSCAFRVLSWLPSTLALHGCRSLKQQILLLSHSFQPTNSGRQCLREACSGRDQSSRQRKNRVLGRALSGRPQNVWAKHVSSLGLRYFIKMKELELSYFCTIDNNDLCSDCWGVCLFVEDICLSKNLRRQRYFLYAKHSTHLPTREKRGPHSRVLFYNIVFFKVA